ncbi:MAG: FAD-dependent oxidoreductase, partial [Myxococcales bacterium]|nr:FAD-dependent oxidoreductase [Myxococcales bacterium]
GGGEGGAGAGAGAGAAGEAGAGVPARTRRSYSIASPPDGTPRFAIAVTRVEGGPVSNWLHGLASGEKLRFVGPQGFFTRPASGGPPSLMIATGTGVAPMRSMVHAAMAAGARAPITLLLGVRREEDLIYAGEFAALARQQAFFQFAPTLSRPEDGWAGRRGYVQAHVRDLWGALVAAAGDARPHAYVCGLERMVGSVRALLRKDMGLAREQVHTERYD